MKTLSLDVSHRGNFSLNTATATGGKSLDSTTSTTKPDLAEIECHDEDDWERASLGNEIDTALHPHLGVASSFRRCIII